MQSNPGFHAIKKTATSSNRKGKGKGRAMCDEFDLERKAVLARLSQEQDPSYEPSPSPDTAAGPSKAVDPADIPLPEGTGIECGCCFGEYEFDNMIQCPEAHLFCKDCARRNAEEAIGHRKSSITCMDQSSEWPFDRSAGTGSLLDAIRLSLHA